MAVASSPRARRSDRACSACLVTVRKPMQALWGTFRHPSGIGEPAASRRRTASPRAHRPRQAHTQVNAALRPTAAAASTDGTHPRPRAPGGPDVHGHRPSERPRRRARQGRAEALRDRASAMRRQVGAAWRSPATHAAGRLRRCPAPAPGPHARHHFVRRPAPTPASTTRRPGRPAAALGLRAHRCNAAATMPARPPPGPDGSERGSARASSRTPCPAARVRDDDHTVRKPALASHMRRPALIARLVHGQPGPGLARIADHGSRHPAPPTGRSTDHPLAIRHACRSTRRGPPPTA